jgi:thiamine kinase-like enzyme
VDLAALRFLGEVALGVGPGVVSADREAREFVMEDLGGDRTLDTVLRAGTETVLREAVRSLGGVMGRLHCATMDLELEPQFLAACGDLGVAAHGRAAEAARWRDGLRRVREWCEAAGAGRPAGFDAWVAQIEAHYREPGEWLAFTHGDPAPTNAHLANGVASDVRLVDFEYGGYRHALYDVTAWWVLCPLPDAVERELRTAFRKELVGALPAARDEAMFEREWATLVAYRALAIFSWLPLTVLREDHEWVEGWGARARLVATADRLQAATDGVGGWEAMAAMAKRLAVGLRRLWPEVAEGDVLPRWGYTRDATP